jgi:pimeloyl-ACP methyl ester carboxylesterase
VFVRGWLSHIGLMWHLPPFRAYFEALSEQFRVVRFDMRGNGLSDRDVGRIDLAAMALDIEAVVEGVVGDRCTLYAQCFGGPAGITYAAAHPERVERLILDGTYADGRRIARPERLQQMVRTLRDIPEAGFAFMTHMTHPNPGPSPFRQHDADSPNLSVDTAVRLYTLGFTCDVTALLPKITMPTLVMHRSGTRAIPFRLGRELASSIRGARFVPLEGQAHNTWEENPDVAIDALGDFLGVPLHLDTIEEPVERLLTIVVISAVPDGASGGVSVPDLIRNAIRGNNGVEITHGGEEIMAFFASAPGAVECAMMVQQDLAGRASTRIGVHAGAPVFQGGEPADTVVSAAKQASAQGAPSEIIVTEAVRDACAGRGFLFAERETRGGSDTSKLFAVRWRADS